MTEYSVVTKGAGCTQSLINVTKRKPQVKFYVAHNVDNQLSTTPTSHFSVFIQNLLSESSLFNHESLQWLQFPQISAELSI